MSALLKVLETYPRTEASTPNLASPFGSLRRVRLSSEGEAVSIETGSVVELPVQARTVEEPQIDIESLIKAAREDEAAAAAARLQEALDAQRREFAEIAQALRAQWVSEHAEAIAKKIEQGLEIVELELGERIGNVLHQFLAEAFRGQAIAETADLLNSIVTDSEVSIIRVSGPEDLLDALKERLHVGVTAVEFVPEPSIDVSITVNDALIETQLHAWSQRLSTLQKAG
ncbi:hypothetical protein AB4099_28240 [Bosea sp. 2KB_26]|uniref:hypothetical protein n=1 Tax=Bosea sp. 2KB_26 TaxID=3237475 RepID=UPI003F93D436